MRRSRAPQPRRQIGPTRLGVALLQVVPDLQGCRRALADGRCELLRRARRTSPAAKTPGTDVAIMRSVTMNPRSSRSTSPLSQSGVRVEADEHERPRRRKCSTRCRRRPERHRGELAVVVGLEAHRLVLEPTASADGPSPCPEDLRAGRDGAALDDGHVLGELGQEQPLLEPEFPPPITTSSSAPL